VWRRPIERRGHRPTTKPDSRVLPRSGAMATMTRDDLVAEIPVLYRFARALVRDDDLAADLTQDTSKRHGTTTGTRSTRP
jgi:hypothetical protein